MSDDDEHEHDWHEVARGVIMIDDDQWFRGVCHTNDDCAWAFRHTDIDAVRNMMTDHLKEHA